MTCPCVCDSANANSNSFIRKTCSQMSTLSPDADTWLKRVDVLIEFAHDLVRFLLVSNVSQLTTVLRDC